MSEHLRPTSPRYWGVLAQDADWRLVLAARGGYALQAAAPDGWQTCEVFPSAGWLLVHLGEVYPVSPGIVRAASALPDCPPDTRQARRDLVARCSSQRPL